MWERVLRWPILCFISIALTIDFVLYLFLRSIVIIYEYLFTRTLNRTRQSMQSRLENASTLQERQEIARECDDVEGNEKWKSEPGSPYYNSELILHLTRQIKECKGDHKRLAELMGNAVLRSDVGGIDNSLLYSQTYCDTKKAIEEFIDCSVDAIETIRESKELSTHEKRLLGENADRYFGQTALCLSGGATFGFYHLGVLKVLVEHDSLPRVISGTSAGAALAAWLCTRTLKELSAELLDPYHLADLFTFTSDSWAVRLWRLVKQGHMLDVEDSLRRGKRICGGSVTFLEAYKNTGRVLNITVNSATPHAPPRILNYQTSPHVLIYSAILASASVPGLLPALQLRSKGPTGTSAISSPRDLLSSQVSLADTDYVIFDELGSHWRDGSISIDIPTDLLRPLFNVRYTIVSQVNPGVVYFFYHSRGAVGEPHAHRQGKGWRGGFLMSLCEMFLKLDMKRYLELLAAMDLLPKFLRLDWSLLALQRRDGTVTILPKGPSLLHLFSKLLAIPTPASMRECIRIGEMAAWPSLHMINNRMRIEKSIATLMSLN